MYREEPVACHVATNGLRVAQFEPALYADKARSQTIGGELLLGIGRRQVAEMLVIDA